jgi:para-nitrobenzyl esterase
MQPVQLVQFLFLGLFGFLGLLGVEAFASGPIVHTQNGDVRGVSQGQVESFKGLPYAAPPVGPLRWMPPQPPADWTGKIRDASYFSAKCPQKRPDDVFIGNEDCLYLNVFRPSNAKALPVMVFIHGGSNVVDSASDTLLEYRVPVYDGSRLAQNENMVVVTLNYRLGTLGFMVHKRLSALTSYKGSGNYAYMDQIQALQWVQSNIAAFGGDPGNVTLVGQSAGAKSVWVLMTSPLSKGLFHRAIVHSGLRESAKDLASAANAGAMVSDNLNCWNDPDELACLRNKSAKEIVNALPSVRGTGFYAAVVDKYVLEHPPILVMHNGNHHHVPILQGNVEEEASMLGEQASMDIKTVDDYKKAVENAVLNGSIPGGSVIHVLGLYPPREYPSPAQAYNAIFADKDFICSSRSVLRELSGNQSEFVGRFFYNHVFSDGPLVKYGASHGFELLFLFDTLSGASFSPTADEVTLVKLFQHKWAEFARTGTAPPSWERYDRDKDNYVILDPTMPEESDHLQPKQGLHTKQCDYWDSQQ